MAVGRSGRFATWPLSLRPRMKRRKQLALWARGEPLRGQGRRCAPLEGAARHREAAPRHGIRFAEPATVVVRPWTLHGECARDFVQACAIVGAARRDVASPATRRPARILAVEVHRFPCAAPHGSAAQGRPRLRYDRNSGLREQLRYVAIASIDGQRARREPPELYSRATAATLPAVSAYSRRP